MRKKEFLMYDVPKVEIIEVEVEKGFSISDESDGDVTVPGMGNLG